MTKKLTDNIIENNWSDLPKLVDYSKSGILSKVIKTSDKINITLFCMAKNTNISEHITTKEGMVYVLEGEGVFNLEGKDILMKQGVLIFLNKNAKHSLDASKDTSFLLVLYPV